MTEYVYARPGRHRRLRRIATGLAVTVLVPTAGFAFEEPLASATTSIATVPASLAFNTVPPGAAVPTVAESQPHATMSAWAWPVDPPWVVLGPYRAPATPYSSGHRGIDLQSSAGAFVVAPADGSVHFAGTVVDRPVLTIAVGDDVLASFEPVEALTPKGERVARGQVIGVVRAGGHCEDSCVHLGVRINGEYVSPLLFLGGVPRAVLLPLDR